MTSTSSSHPQLVLRSLIVSALSFWATQAAIADTSAVPRQSLRLLPAPVTVAAIDSHPQASFDDTTKNAVLSADQASEPAPIALDSDLWQRIRNGYAIPNLDNPLVNNHLAWYGARTDYMLRTVNRGSRYLFHVVEELEKRGMPTELALLPFIESAFNPQAISTAKASGMWQFMAATGRDYNLKQSVFKDDRRGVLDSTDAALTYLQRLYTQFGDWQLALAAYNWGEGSVQRAMKKQQARGLPTDFESLSALMPAETRNYVPKLLAVKQIIGAPEQYNLTLPKLDNQPYFATVEKTRDIDVRVAAKLAELSVHEFTALNPQFNRPVITGTAGTKILLPTENAELFKENLTKWDGPLSSWSTYTVQKTEKVELLAKRVGVSIDQMREVNFIPAKMLVKAGSTILIPRTHKSADQDISAELADKAQLIIEKEPPAARPMTIRVGSRDSLASVAKRYKVSVAQIKSWNNLKRDSLNAGQSLRIMVQAKHMAAKPGKIKAALKIPKKSLTSVSKPTKNKG
jgi:membrane-bound lytic murein transglycosylase D